MVEVQEEESSERLPFNPDEAAPEFDFNFSKIIAKLINNYIALDPDHMLERAENVRL